MRKPVHVRAFVVSLTLLAAGALPVRAQTSPTWRGPVVEYRLATGTMQGVPITAGRTVRIRMLDQNPLCHAYSFDAKPRLAAIDLAKLTSAYGSVSGAATTVPITPPTPPSAPAVTQPLPSPGENFIDQPRARAVTVMTVTDRVRTATDAVARARDVVTEVEAALAIVERPTCNGTVPVGAVRAEWQKASARTRANGLLARILGARSDLRDARVERAALNTTRLGTLERAGLAEADSQLRAATATLDTVERGQPELVRRTARADAIVEALKESDTGTTMDVHVPQGTDTLHLAITRIDRVTADGRPAAPVVQTVAIPVRNGMRFFVSVGAMASSLRPSDYQRVTRQYADTTRGVYTTYANVLRRPTLAFSPVLQGNVAFRDVQSSGVSMLLSAGVAARSVNGTTAPEFLVGAGLGFLDRFVFTGGVHLGRRERLLLGSPRDVEAGPVSDKITDASAIGVEWRPALVGAFSVRLN